MKCFNLAELFLIPCLCVFGSPTATAQINLAFGVYTSDKPTTMVKKFRPLLNELEGKLSKSLGEPVTIKMQIANSYKQGLANIVQGKVDFSRLGPATYVKAKIEQPAISLLAMESKNGKKEFNGIICVKKGGAIKSIQDIKGKGFAFGNRQSTIGRYLAQQYLYRSGIKITDLKHYTYHKRHDQVAYAVAKGDFDAGSLKESTYKRLIKNGLQLEKLATFKNVTKPWIARADLPANQRKALKQALLTFHTKTDISKYKNNPFLKSTDSDYSIIRKSIIENDQFFSIH